MASAAAFTLSPHAIELMKQFDDYGRMKLQGTLLTCAQIKARKLYDFSPLVITRAQLAATTYLLANTHETVPAKTVICVGDHYQTIHFYFPPGKNPKILILNSLGYDTDSDGDWVHNIATEIHKILPSAKIYTNLTKLQHASVGCSFFAIHGARTLAKILATMSNAALFEYLEAHKLKSRRGICRCHIPLPFILTKQSATLWNHTVYRYADEEKASFRNKKGQTLTEAITAKQREDSKGKQVNARLNLFLESTRDHNLRYLSDKTDAEVIAGMIPFTLAAAASAIGQPSILMPVIAGESFFEDMVLTREIFIELCALGLRCFRNVNLMNLDLSNLDLRGLDFSGSQIAGTNFTGSIWDLDALKTLDIGMMDKETCFLPPEKIYYFIENYQRDRDAHWFAFARCHFDDTLRAHATNPALQGFLILKHLKQKEAHNPSARTVRVFHEVMSTEYRRSTASTAITTPLPPTP